MLKLIQSEIYKLKRSWIFLIGLIGSLIGPVMSAGTYFIWWQRDNGAVPKMFEVVEFNLFISSLLFGMLLYSLITIFIINREFSEKTVGTMLSIPVSRFLFLLSKLIFTLTYILLLNLFSYAALLILSFLLGFTGFNLPQLFEYLFYYITSVLLMLPIICLVSFITLLAKNYIIPLAVTIVGAILGVLIIGNDIGYYFPWTIPTIIANTKFNVNPELVPTSVGITMVSSVFVLILLFVSFNRRDVKE